MAEQPGVELSVELEKRERKGLANLQHVRSLFLSKGLQWTGASNQGELRDRMRVPSTVSPSAGSTARQSGSCSKHPLKSSDAAQDAR